MTRKDIYRITVPNPNNSPPEWIVEGKATNHYNAYKLAIRKLMQEKLLSTPPKMDVCKVEKIG